MNRPTLQPEGSRGNRYTRAQRRIIDRGIAKGVKEIRNGRKHGPFRTADAAIAHLQSLTRSRRKTVPRKPV